MITPLSILSLDQGPKWTEPPAAPATARPAKPSRSLALLRPISTAAIAAARRFALRHGQRAG
jgi:hypothetical protein